MNSISNSSRYSTTVQALACTAPLRYRGQHGLFRKEVKLSKLEMETKGWVVFSMPVPGGTPWISMSGITEPVSMQARHGW